jgi:hypothetical protein
MEEAGVPAAFVAACLAGVPPSHDAVGCVPLALDAFCLNASGLALVRRSRVLGSLRRVLTTKPYLKTLQSERPCAPSRPAPAPRRRRFFLKPLLRALLGLRRVVLCVLRRAVRCPALANNSAAPL